MELTAERRRVDRARGVLIGSRCPSCGATSWPARARCQRCAAEMQADVPLATEGSLVSFTKMWVERPGQEVPYTLGQVAIGDAIFFAHVRNLPDDAHVPMPVRVVVPAEGVDEALQFWFEPPAGRSSA